MNTTLNLTLDVTPFLTWLVGLLGRVQKPAKASAPALYEVMSHDAQPFTETLVKIAQSQIGVKEEGGNNRGKQVQAYQAATWLTGTGWAWCAAFVCWVIYQALQIHGAPTNWKRPRTAGAYDFENWAQGKKPHGPNGAWRCLKSTPGAPPKRGDIITFTWSHIGIVTGYDEKNKIIYTVEGNAGRGAVSDSSVGDGVVAKQHPVTKCRRLIRYIG
ncbi:MAG TPA: CHAP domain-containing protein [Prosthecobacter sp.]